MILTTEQLCVQRGERVLVPALDLALGEGELLHVRGANGSGKTSLLELLAGVREPRGGCIRRIADAPPHWVGHRNALSLSLSAVENLEFWCGVNGIDASGIAAALEAMELPRAARRRPVRTLSAGQKRRCALARLLLVSRPLWLLDEPLDGLDATGIARFGEVLAGHLGHGGAVVMTSHQPLPAALAPVRELRLEDVRR